MPPTAAYTVRESAQPETFQQQASRLMADRKGSRSCCNQSWKPIDGNLIYIEKKQ